MDFYESITQIAKLVGDSRRTIILLTLMVGQPLLLEHL